MLISKTILELFLKNPDKDYHIRELAYKLKLSPTTATKYLEILTKKGLLSKKKERSHIIYEAFTQNSNFKLAKLTYNLEQLQKTKLTRTLEEFYNHPEAIILFGSYSKGEDSQKSDIDIAVITAKKDFPKLQSFETRLGRQIQIFPTTSEKIRKNQHLTNKLINGIVLLGFWEYENEI